MISLHVVIGCDQESRVPAKVLEHSIRARASIPVKFHHATEDMTCLPRDHEFRKRTGFSCARFLAPGIVRHAGGDAGLYLDSDMLVFHDIVGILAYLPTAPAVISRSESQTAVLLFDPFGIKWTWIDLLKGWADGKWTYKDLVSNLACESGVEVKIPPRWNSLDRYNKDTRLLHYTDMRRQPWKHPGHPHADVWYSALRDAITLQPSLAEWVVEDVRRGYMSAHVTEVLRALV